MAIGNPLNDGWIALPDEHAAFRKSDPERFVNAIGQLCQFQPGMLHLDRQDSQVRSGMAAMIAQ
jgi:hypothetical protein